MKRLSSRVLWLAVAAICAGCGENPATGKKQLVLFSEQQEIEQGNQIYPIATQLSHGETPHPETQSFVQQVGGSIARSSERASPPWQFNVVDPCSPDVRVAQVPAPQFAPVRRRPPLFAGSRQTLIGLLLSVSG